MSPFCERIIWDEPKKITGTITAIDDEYSDTYKKLVPVLSLRTDRGRAWRVPCAPVELYQWITANREAGCVGTGDRISIAYRGKGYIIDDATGTVKLRADRTPMEKKRFDCEKLPSLTTVPAAKPVITVDDF